MRLVVGVEGKGLLPRFARTCSMTPMPVEPMLRPNEPIFAAKASPWPFSRSGTSAMFMTGLIACPAIALTLRGLQTDLI